MKRLRVKATKEIENTYQWKEKKTGQMFEQCMKYINTTSLDLYKFRYLKK